MVQTDVLSPFWGERTLTMSCISCLAGGVGGVGASTAYAVPYAKTQGHPATLAMQPLRVQ